NPNGVWLRGASLSEVILVTAEPVKVVRFRVHSLSDWNVFTADSGIDRIKVVFDSDAKRHGTPIDLQVKPVARDLGFFGDAAPHEYFYRFYLTTTDGVVPAHRFGEGDDLRYLGTFLDFTGKGP
ncbi:MAG TPA: hypothetical protein VGR07_12635, partial [Thermoanaerobaculia bacterium]|nr:hypothetical protein [Thermoanaerobaculia bacterium]